MLAAVGFMFWIEPEMKEGIVMLAGNKNDIAAASAVSAAGSAPRDKLFTPEREATVAPVPCFDLDFYFINEQSG